MPKRSSRAVALLVGLLAVAALVATPAVAAGQGGPPWGPGPGGPEVIHVMHGNGAGRPGGRTTTPPPLSYRGGSVETAPTVVLVIWGSQWITAGDPSGEQGYLARFLTGLYGSSETWSTSTTQYCQGVASGATSCAGTSAVYAAHP